MFDVKKRRSGHDDIPAQCREVHEASQKDEKPLVRTISAFAWFNGIIVEKLFMVALIFSPIFAPRSDLRDLCALCVKFLLVPCTDRLLRLSVLSVIFTAAGRKHLCL